MSPGIVSLGFPAADWAVDRTWPTKNIVPTAAGAGFNSGFTRYQFGAADAATWPFDWSRGSHSGGGDANAQTAGGVWAAVADGVAGTGNAGLGMYAPMWRPSINPLTCPIGEDDPNQRICWIRLWVLEDAAQADPTIADSLGFQVLPDDGLAFSSATWPVAGNGGFGIFRRVGNDGYRYASYSGAPALLESINLATGAGWHSADLIIRQAVFGDAATPWLTVRWDDVDVITERPFGHAALAAPQSIRANAHGWAFYFGLMPTDTGRMALRSRIRIGRFHPDGFVQPF